MKLNEKKLPKGFTYMLTKKDIAKINIELDNCILSITQEGTSYSETKMEKNWNPSLLVLRFETEELDSGLFFHIFLKGIRKSNFKDGKTFIQSKSEIINDLVIKIKDKKEDFTNNRIKHEMTFIWIERKK